MTRAQLEHAIRAACALLETDTVYVVGSQSILASYPGLSGCVAKSNEADIVSRLREGDQDRRPDHEALEIEGTLGADSRFFQTHGFMVEGLVEEDLCLPARWKERLIPLSNANTGGCTGLCLERYDMAAAKLVAGRTKDRDALVNLMRQGILKQKELLKRIDEFEPDHLPEMTTHADLKARMRRWTRLAGAG
jgi:hypothetical protein